MQCKTGTVINLGSLLFSISKLGDKRKPKGKRYSLATICGDVSGEVMWEDKPSGIAEWVALRGEWIASVLGLKRRVCPATTRIGVFWQMWWMEKNLKTYQRAFSAIVEKLAY